jgi:chromate transporter
VTHTPSPARAPHPAGGSVAEVFWAFLRLGVTSLGGPIAHLGYFRDDLVARRRWMSDKEYADLVALCQFLPGPASSQVGFAMGLHRAGAWGAIAAFLAFTLPSAALMIAFAYGATLFEGVIGQGLLTGLKIVAVAIVAQAVWGMARMLTPDARRASIAVVAAVVALLLAGSLGQVIAIGLGALAGVLLCRIDPAAASGTDADLIRFPVRRAVGIGALVSVAALLVILPVLTWLTGNGAVSLVDAFFRAGALVFGGGHVVLPLLEVETVAPGWVSPEQFLAGYGAVQAMPGPLFTFAAYLGTLSTVGPGGVVGGLLALLAIFLPGFLILLGVLPFWNALRGRTTMRALMRGANAAVVGILAAAL